MTYEPLHHKYRPRKFAELVGQEAIATTLTNAITGEKIAPAYLFTGPRGTGKTSSARILAKSLNCIESDSPTASPCGKCEVCRSIADGSALDVIEIDAASNTGVDNIREIIERARFAPVRCRYKVYVIDECHMLSVAAFNALLKTLEEPPDRVVFVLATTDPQRVLPTIISRCQRFDFRRIPLEAMVGHLDKIARQESIDIEENALTLVARIANGGLRDAESLLDQLSLLTDTITPSRVWELVGAVPEQELLSLIKAVRENSPEKVIERCRHLIDRGKEPLAVLQNLAGFYLNLLLARTAPSRPDLAAVTEPTWRELCLEGQHWSPDNILQGQQILKNAETQIKNTTQPHLWLEVTLLGLLDGARPAAVNTKNPPPQRKEDDRPAPETRPENPPPEAVRVKPVDVPSPPPETPKPPGPTPPPPVDNDTIAIWERVLEVMEPPTTKTLMRQQGTLLALNDSDALLGLPTEALLGIARTRIANVEAAFAKVFQRRIKVNLQVGHSSRSESEKNNVIPFPVKIPPSIEAPAVKPPAIIINEPVIGETEKEERVLEPKIEVEAEEIPVPERELNEAAKILAKNFDGEIVGEEEKTDTDTGTDTGKGKNRGGNTFKLPRNVRQRLEDNEILENIESEDDLPF